MITSLGQLVAPELSFTPMTWAAFALANGIIMVILGPRLWRDARDFFRRRG